jgi:glycosyltransferase involved in cell wall biosynthesis
MNTPLVSVLMAAYNSEKYIAEAIESVLASTFTDFELIICDDRSTDNTASIAKSYQHKDTRVKVYINETNLGDYPNRNKVASYASGTYLKYLDHDDVIYPWGLGIMVACMQAFPDAGYGLISHGIVQQKPYPLKVNPISAYRYCFFNNALMYIGPSGAIITKKAFDDVGGFSGKPFVGDLEIWLKLSKKYNMVRMPTDIIWYRIHDMQESKREKNDPNAEVRRFKVLEDALNCSDCPLTNDERLIALKKYKKTFITLSIKRDLRNFNFSKLIKTFKKCNITISDILTVFKKLEIPNY